MISYSPDRKSQGARGLAPPGKFAYLNLLHVDQATGAVFVLAPPSGRSRAGDLYVLPCDADEPLRCSGDTPEAHHFLERWDGLVTWKAAAVSKARADGLARVLAWYPEALRRPWMQDRLLKLRRSRSSQDHQVLRRALEALRTGTAPGLKQIKKLRRCVPVNNAIFLETLKRIERGAPYDPQEIRRALQALQASGTLPRTKLPAASTIYEVQREYGRYFSRWHGPPPENLKQMTRILSALTSVFSDYA